MRSEALIVCLKIADVPSSTAIDRCVSRVPLMSRSAIPAGERQWTCRVYVKEALIALHNDRLLNLPASVSKLSYRSLEWNSTYNLGTIDSIERACLAAADYYLPHKSATRRVSIYNDLAWMSRSTSHTTPIEETPDLYCHSNIEVDSTARYTPYHSYGSLRDVDSSGGRRVSRQGRWFRC